MYRGRAAQTFAVQNCALPIVKQLGVCQDQRCKVSQAPSCSSGTRCMFGYGVVRAVLGLRNRQTTGSNVRAGLADHTKKEEPAALRSAGSC